MSVNNELIMNLIINAGDAKSNVMEAIYATKKNDFDTAAEKLSAANSQINKAHKSQTGLLIAEASGDSCTRSFNDRDDVSRLGVRISRVLLSNIS